MFIDNLTDERMVRQIENLLHPGIQQWILLDILHFVVYYFSLFLRYFVGIFTHFYFVVDKNRDMVIIIKIQNEQDMKSKTVYLLTN